MAPNPHWTCGRRGADPNAVLEVKAATPLLQAVTWNRLSLTDFAVEKPVTTGELRA